MSKADLEQQRQEHRAPGWRINLFLLGGDFWEKLRLLFIHNATVMVPEKPGTEG